MACVQLRGGGEAQAGRWVVDALGVDLLLARAVERFSRQSYHLSTDIVFILDVLLLQTRETIHLVHPACGVSISRISLWYQAVR